MTEKVSYTENGKINFDQSVVEIKPVDQINMVWYFNYQNSIQICLADLSNLIL